jgi:rubredoxin
VERSNLEGQCNSAGPSISRLFPSQLKSIPLRADGYAVDKPSEQWTWIVHCPDCLATKSLGPEDFNGETKIIFKCGICGFEKEVENPEPQETQD